MISEIFVIVNMILAGVYLVKRIWAVQRMMYKLLDDMCKEMRSMRKEMREMCKEMRGMCAEMREMRKEMRGMRKEQTGFREQVTGRLGKVDDLREFLTNRH